MSYDQGSARVRRAGHERREGPRREPTRPAAGEFAPRGRVPHPSAPAPARPTPSRSGRTPAGKIPHFAGLEGLRGLAVLAVVLFHARFDWMGGGFLGVSTFFTLSGFLITSLLLNERGATGTIDLRAFWTRRVRRLMPASLLTLALIAAGGFAIADAVQQRNLAGDVLAALGYVANWRFLLSQQSYADLFGAPSPVQHFWSLAIEEQFYLAFPLLLWLAMVRVRLQRRGLALLLGALAVLSLALTLFAGLSTDAIYYGTGTRATELLTGALLAVALFSKPITVRLASHRPTQLAVVAAGGLALVVCAALWVTVAHADAWLYRGGFALYSVLTVLVILAAITPWGPVRGLLAARPLRGLGAISYGVYLYHWPIFVWLDAGRTGWAPEVLVPVQLALTLVLAIGSYKLVESPIRTGSWARRGWRIGRLAPLPVVAIAAAVIMLTANAPAPVLNFEKLETDLAAAGSDGAIAKPAPKIDVKAVDPPFPRMAFFGDSTALATSYGLVRWSDETKRSEVVPGSAHLGCGIGRGGLRRDRVRVAEPLDDRCNRWALSYKQKLQDFEPTVAVVQVGPWETRDRKLEGDDQWRAFGDPVYDDFMRKEMDAAVDLLSSQGAVVIWLTSPLIITDEQGRSPTDVRGTAGEPQRMVRLNELIRELPARRPGQVEVVDLAAWVASLGAEDSRLRRDGEHFDQDTAPEVAHRYLGEQILGAYRNGWQTRVEAGAPPPTDEGTTRTLDPATIDKFVSRKLTVAVVGDINAGPVVDALAQWSDRNRGIVSVINAIRPKCGVLRTDGRVVGDRKELTPPECTSARDQWLRTVREQKPDVVLMVPSFYDLTEVRIGDQQPYRAWGDADHDRTAVAQYDELRTAFNKAGAVVMWLNLADPAVTPSVAPVPPTLREAYAPDRVAGFNAAMEQVHILAMLDLTGQRIDLAKFASRWPAGAPPMLANGISLNPDAYLKVGDWLGPELIVRFDDFLGTYRKLRS